MKQSYVLSGKLLQDEDANRSKKESPSPAEQATDALPFVHLKARPKNRQRCVFMLIVFYCKHVLLLKSGDLVWKVFLLL